MASPSLAASGIILILLGLILYFVPVENMIPIDSQMSPAEICDSLRDLGNMLPPKYRELCDAAAPIIKNPSPYIIYAAFISIIVGIILTIVGLVQKKKPSMFMCKECDYAGNTKADLYNHNVEKHKQIDESKEVYVAELSKKQSEPESLDTHTIFSLRPEMREDDKEIIKFISENGGQVFESDLRKKFLQPRTTMWRAVKRLERLGVVEIYKKDLLNIVKLRNDLEEEI